MTQALFCMYEINTMYGKLHSVESESDTMFSEIQQ